MVQPLLSVSPRYVLLATALLAGSVGLRASHVSPATPPPVVLAPAVLEMPAVAVTAVMDEPPIESTDAVVGPDGFAMVFEVDGVSYVRLSMDERATARGPARFVEDKSFSAVVAPVTTNAMPAGLRGWAGKNVVVDGRCAARVVGFAEVSRVSGDPPGTEDYYWTEEDKRPAHAPRWTKKLVAEQNVMLAARLDTVGECKGLWARTEHAPAQVLATVADATIEHTAVETLFAHSDEQQQGWKEMGGEGHWREHAHIDANAYVHPVTGERWVIARATTGAAGCGEPSASQMSVYRVGADRTLQHVADLSYDGQVVSVVDIDADGQPEILIEGPEGIDVVDVNNAVLDSISIQYFTWGCGC